MNTLELVCLDLHGGLYVQVEHSWFSCIIIVLYEVYCFAMVVKVNIEVQCISWNSYNDIWDFIEFKGFDLVYMFKVFENSAQQFYDIDIFVISSLPLLFCCWMGAHKEETV